MRTDSHFVKDEDAVRAMLVHNQRLLIILLYNGAWMKIISSSRNAFMERLKRVILDYEETIARLETGQEKVHRTSRFGEKEDISIQTADHYRRLLSHYMEIVARNEVTKTKAERKK